MIGIPHLSCERIAFDDHPDERLPAKSLYVFATHKPRLLGGGQPAGCVVIV